MIYSSRWVPTMKAVGYTTPLTHTLPVSAICCVQDLQWVSIICSFILSPLPPACKSWQANITRRHGAAASHMNNQETSLFELRDRSSMSHSALRQDSEQCNETPPISEEPEASWKKEGCNRGTRNRDGRQPIMKYQLEQVYTRASTLLFSNRICCTM